MNKQIRLSPFVRLLTITTAVLLLNGCGLFDIGGSVVSGKSVTINGVCEAREDDGYYDKINVNVINNMVQSMDWTANPRQGKCRFQLKDFTQVATQPQTDLQSRFDRKCHIFIWQDARFITIAANNCTNVCPVNDHLLPVLLDPVTAGCSKVTR